MDSSLRGLAVVLGAQYHILGAGDEAERDRRVSDRAMRMAKLRQVPVSIAQALLAGGQVMIDKARSEDKVPSMTSATGVATLPGASARDKVYGKLKWHEAELKKLASTPNVIYASGADLKNWVLQAFAEYDAVLEGQATLDHAWSMMWAEIGERLAALPAALQEAVQDIAWYAKWTYWAAIGGAVIALGLVGWGVGAGIKNRIEK